MNDNRIHFTSVNQFLKSVLLKTEIGSTVFQFYSVRLAYKKGLIHKEVDFKTLPDTTLSASFVKQQLEHQKTYLTGYQTRLQEIITLCKTNGIQPILLTQPSLYGAYVDSATGIKMDTKYYPIDGNIKNNLLQEQVLEEYNNVVRSFQNQAAVIDLSKLMPKNTAYFYDFIHFNKKGSVKVANLLTDELRLIIK